jgi:hypothetical protein
MHQLLTFAAGVIASIGSFFMPAAMLGDQGISQLQQFTGTTSPSSAITQATFGKALKITGLATGACLSLDSNNILTTTACGSGGSSFSWTPTTNFGALANATGTPIWFQAGLQASSTSYISKLVGRDPTNLWSGVTNPTRYLSLSAGTTTTWTATTSAPYSPAVVAPFAGTMRDISCIASTTQAFLGVQVLVNNTVVSPYFVSSSTPGIVTFTANNTFARGDRIVGHFGTTTTDAAALSDTCTIRATETP